MTRSPQGTKIHRTPCRRQKLHS